MTKQRQFLRTGVAAAWAFCLGAAHAAGPMIIGPYKDLNMGASAGQTLAVSTMGAPDGRLQPWLEALPARGQPASGKGYTLTLAFASGECGQETWGGLDGREVARANRLAFMGAQQPYIVSTGGEAETFKCNTAAGFQDMLRRWDSPWLVGVDFDIERKQTPEDIEQIMRRVGEAQKTHPKLKFSVTLATHAGSDGQQANLNALGLSVLKAVQRHGLKHVIFNLMVMNYGPADSRYCVVKSPQSADGPRCDMAASAKQAALNVHHKHGIPLSQISLTAMLGENDVAGNVTTVDDWKDMLKWSKAKGLAGVHYWSFDRDRPCETGSARVSPLCHGLTSPDAAAPFRFHQAIHEALSQ